MPAQPQRGYAPVAKRHTFLDPQNHVCQLSRQSANQHEGLCSGVSYSGAMDQLSYWKRGGVHAYETQDHLENVSWG